MTKNSVMAIILSAFVNCMTFSSCCWISVSCIRYFEFCDLIVSSVREMLWQLLEPLCICDGSLSDFSCTMLKCVCVVLC